MSMFRIFVGICKDGFVVVYSSYYSAHKNMASETPREGLVVASGVDLSIKLYPYFKNIYSQAVLKYLA